MHKRKQRSVTIRFVICLIANSFEVGGLTIRAPGQWGVFLRATMNCAHYSIVCFLLFLFRFVLHNNTKDQSLLFLPRDRVAHSFDKCSIQSLPWVADESAGTRISVGIGCWIRCSRDIRLLSCIKTFYLLPCLSKTKNL